MLISGEGARSGLLRSGHGGSLPWGMRSSSPRVGVVNPGPAAPEVVVKLAETAGNRQGTGASLRLRYGTYAIDLPAFTANADHASRRLTGTYDERSELLAAYSQVNAVAGARAERRWRACASPVDRPRMSATLRTGRCGVNGLR